MDIPGIIQQGVHGIWNIMILNKDIVNSHCQLDQFSCIPMAIEFVLKLIGRIPPDSYEIQRSWNNRNDGDFSVFDGLLIHGVRFCRQYWRDRTEHFPIDNLFHTIDSELAAERYVIISLPVGGNWHNYIVYDALSSGEYRSITKGRSPEAIDNVRELVRSVMGTDIMTYAIED